VGKTYVSAVALQLVHEKKIGLDDPISKYLGAEPWFKRLPNADRITVRQLMTHTSGLVRYELNPKFTADLTANPDKVWTPADRLAYLFDAQPPFAPGEGWEYSDTNYIVLGMIKAGKFAINPQFEWTGGGLAVTAIDLARWAKLLYEGKVIDSALMDDLLNGLPAKLGPETKYGLGVIIRPTPQGTTYGHSGFMPGYQTDMMYFPELKTSIAVQVNSSAPRSTGRPLSRFLIEFAAIVAASAQRPAPSARILP
jgi:D-alanyl-D-alanine carboxypeptidase